MALIICFLSYLVKMKIMSFLTSLGRNTKGIKELIIIQTVIFVKIIKVLWDVTF